MLIQPQHGTGQLARELRRRQYNANVLRESLFIGRLPTKKVEKDLSGIVMAALRGEVIRQHVAELFKCHFGHHCGVPDPLQFHMSAVFCPL